MGAINWFIDTLDKKWGEQAMQKKLNEKDELLEGKDEQLGKKRRTDRGKRQDNPRAPEGEPEPPAGPETRRRRGRRRWDGQPDLEAGRINHRTKRVQEPETSGSTPHTRRPAPGS